MAKLAPSILSADFSKLGEEVSIIEGAGAHYIHVDVMDGHFVPNISYGATVMKSLNNKTNLPYDIHLMIENPDMYVNDFVTDKTEFITIHQEAVYHLHRSLQLIKSKGIKAGVSINPATPISVLEEVLPIVDLILIMSVNPGFGGQSLIRSCLDKLKNLKEIREAKGYKYLLEIDGGINLDNVKEAVEAGADIIVAGSAVFQEKDIGEACKTFLKIINNY